MEEEEVLGEGRWGGGGASTVVDLYTCVMRNVQLLVLLIAFII